MSEMPEPKSYAHLVADLQRLAAEIGDKGGLLTRSANTIAALERRYAAAYAAAQAQPPHRESSDAMSSLASAVMRDPASSASARSLAGSVMSQDQTPGKRDAQPEGDEAA